MGNVYRYIENEAYERSFLHGLDSINKSIFHKDNTFYIYSGKRNEAVKVVAFRVARFLYNNSITVIN